MKIKTVEFNDGTIAAIQTPEWNRHGKPNVTFKIQIQGLIQVAEGEMGVEDDFFKKLGKYELKKEGKKYKLKVKKHEVKDKDK